MIPSAHPIRLGRTLEPRGPPHAQVLTHAIPPPGWGKVEQQPNLYRCHSDRILDNLSLKAVGLGVEVELVDDVAGRLEEPGDAVPQVRGHGVWIGKQNFEPLALATVWTSFI